MHVNVHKANASDICVIGNLPYCHFLLLVLLLLPFSLALVTVQSVTVQLAEEGSA